MSIPVLPIDGMSPNVLSGRGAANYDQNSGVFTDGATANVSGTGGSGLATPRAGTTITNHEIEVIPSTIPVPQINAGVGSGNGLLTPDPGVACGLPSPNPGQAATSITNVVPDLG